ncbi:MAG: glycosyltransferase family 4 protein [candidate division WOR-3 bacterium]
MRILLVSASYRPFPSGVSEHVHHLAMELHRRGHKVHILTTNYHPKTKLNTSTSTPFPIARIGKALILPSNRSHFVLPVGLKLPLQVREFLCKNQFDIVHCHGVFPPEISYWAIRYSSAPVVVTFHTLRKQLPIFVRKGFQALFPDLNRKIKVKIAVSQAAKNFFQAWFLGEYHIIPNGVDLTRFRTNPHPAHCLEKDKPYILYVGRLDWRKGVLVLIRSLPFILKSHPEATLVVVGTGPLESKAKRLCIRLGIEKSVIFTGYVPPEELPGYYSGCTLYVSPALSGEAMGIVLLEAMASGKPVIASAISGYNEVVTDRETAILVPPGDAQRLAEAINQLLDSPELCQHLIQKGLRHVTRFAWPVIAQDIEALYEKALS